MVPYMVGVTGKVVGDGLGVSLDVYLSSVSVQIHFKFLKLKKKVLLKKDVPIRE